MLINLKEMLIDAQLGHYAVGSFNVYNYETMKGVFEAAKKTETSRIIVAFGAKYLDNMTLDDAYSMANALSLETGVDACLHLDHCKKTETIWQAIRAGFGSVMYDGSALPFEENLANTAHVCEIAHASGVSVEAELGSLAAGEKSHEGSVTDVEIYTDPEAAKKFVATTGVDCLAVSIGTVHGLYKGEPNIRVDILKDINAACGIPLVLHGGSGIPEETIAACIREGICKINVNTEISNYTMEKTAEVFGGEKLPHLSVLAKMQQQWVAEIVEKYIHFFGCQ